MVNEEILWLTDCTSTNDEAEKRLSQPGLLAVAAMEQTAGRGRMGRSWHSPPGTGLYLSWIARPGFNQSLGGAIPLMAAVATADVCRELGASVSLKWPNDVLADGRKLAGILCEARGVPEAWTAIVGIGLNLVKPPGDWPEDIPGIALSELNVRRCTAEVLARRLVDGLESWLKTVEQHGFRPVLDAWEARGPQYGAMVRRGPMTGTYAGLSADGALRIQTALGMHIVHAGDVEILDQEN